MNDLKCSVGLLVLPVLFGARDHDLFEQRNGIGLLYVQEHAAHQMLTIALFDSIGEGRAHVKWIEMDQRSEWFWQKWEQLLPFHVFDGAMVPMLVCMEQQGEWYRVRLSDGHDYWVKQERKTYTVNGKDMPYDKFSFKKWENFIGEMAWIGRMDRLSNPIHARPRSTSQIIRQDVGDCLSPIAVRDAWVEVTPHNGEGCLSDTMLEDDARFKRIYFDHGWVQWRNDTTFLVRLTPYSR